MKKHSLLHDYITPIYPPYYLHTLNPKPQCLSLHLYPSHRVPGVADSRSLMQAEYLRSTMVYELWSQLLKGDYIVDSIGDYSRFRLGRLRFRAKVRC